MTRCRFFREPSQFEIWRATHEQMGVPIWKLRALAQHPRQVDRCFAHILRPLRKDGSLRPPARAKVRGV